MQEYIDFFNNNKENLALVATGMIAVASALANMFPKATLLGKLVHFLALNFKVDKKT